MDGDRLIEVVLWIFSLVLAIVFFYNGMAKIAGLPAEVAQFEALGIPKTIMQIVGIVECFAGLLLTVPRFVLYSGPLLGLIMLASALMHFLQDHYFPMYRAMVITVMLMGICYLRYRRRPVKG